MLESYSIFRGTKRTLSAPVTRRYSVVAFSLILIFGLSLGIPGEDSPGTAYDESETAPCESTPLFRSAMPRVNACGPRSTLNQVLPLRFSSCTAGCKPDRALKAGLANINSHSLTPVNQTLRC